MIRKVGNYDIYNNYLNLFFIINVKYLIYNVYTGNWSIDQSYKLSIEYSNMNPQTPE